MPQPKVENGIKSTLNQIKNTQNNDNKLIDDISTVTIKDEKDNTSALIEKLKVLLECSICRERFVNPRMLPCQHIFCSNCLSKMEERINWNCPICRKHFPSHSLRSCLLLNNLMELASEYSCLTVVRETSPEPRPPLISEAVDNTYSFYDSDNEDSDGYSIDSSFNEVEDYETIGSYLLRPTLSNYEEFFMFLNDAHNDNDRSTSINSTAQEEQPAPANQTNNTRRHRRNNNNPQQPRRSMSPALIISSRTQNLSNRGGSIFRRCSRWPLCPLGRNCNFVHPYRECQNQRPCPFGNSCCFLHEEDMAHR